MSSQSQPSKAGQLKVFTAAAQFLWTETGEAQVLAAVVVVVVVVVLRLFFL